MSDSCRIQLVSVMGFCHNLWRQCRLGSHRRAVRNSRSFIMFFPKHSFWKCNVPVFKYHLTHSLILLQKWVHKNNWNIQNAQAFIGVSWSPRIPGTQFIKDSLANYGVSNYTMWRKSVQSRLSPGRNEENDSLREDSVMYHVSNTSGFIAKSLEFVESSRCS
jgi:hypothetical protein